MHEAHQVITDALTDLEEHAKNILLRHQRVSVSLLQRYLRMGYASTLALMAELEQKGIVTGLDAQGRRTLTPAFSSPPEDIHRPAAKEVFQEWALKEFSGCDGGDPGSAASPSLWMFGIEHGDAANRTITQEDQSGGDESYSVQTQSAYPYNRSAFKLLAAINGESVENYRDFAERHQPWVKGSKGYFKGNIYPYACRSVATWELGATEFTGFLDKTAYLEWCNENRLPTIKKWVDKYRPRVFIGVGITYHHEYSKAFYGADIPMAEYQFSVNGYLKRIFFTNLNGKLLIVIPHLSGSSHGLNSDEAINIAGSFIAGILN